MADTWPSIWCTPTSGFPAAYVNADIPNDMLLGGPLHQHDIIIEDFKVKDGYVEVPQKPGLGIEVDESIFK